MSDDAFPRLLGDVGGTHARFGWLQDADGAIERIREYACSAHAGLEAALSFYLGEQQRPTPPCCAIGIATTVAGDRVSMTNLDWSFSIRELQRLFDFRQLVVLNDFAALALSVPTLGADDWQRIGGGGATPGAPIALLGPGTGLGVAGLVRTVSGWVPVAGEGGHSTLAAGDPVEERLIAVLRKKFGHVSAERVLSGDGLVNLFRAHCELSGQDAEALSAADIVVRALQGRDPRCSETVERFFGFLGSVAGNLALTLGAHGGVYIGGGIVPRLGARIAASCFRDRFEAKGRFRGYLAGIQTAVITASTAAALRGANQALDNLLAQPDAGDRQATSTRT